MADATTATTGSDTEDAKKPDIMRLKRMFEDARSLTQEARDESMRDQDYYDNFQWTDEQLKILRERRQPETVFNRIGPAVDGMLGIMEQGKSDPRCYMRSPSSKPPAPKPAMGQPQPGQPVMGGNGGPPMEPEEDASDVATKTLRFVADKNRLHALKIAGFRDNLISGCNAAIVEIGADLDIIINPIRWEEFFYDPRSRRADFKDARYMGIAKWVYADQIAAMYPDAKDSLSSIDSIIGGGNDFGGDWSWEDRPDASLQWIDRKQRRVMLVEVYHQETDGWHRSCFCAGNVLETGLSPYLSTTGKPTNPIEGQSAYVDRQNRRYGPVRRMRGPQDAINMGRSRSLHVTNSRQIQESAQGGSPVDADTARIEAARADGVIPPGWQVVPTADMARGAIELTNEAKAEIERLMPVQGVLARQSADSSGRAVLARQAAGTTEYAVLLGQQQDWELRIHHQVWGRARQYWTAPKWIRVTNDVGAPEFLQINEPIPADPDPMTGQVPIDPQTGQLAVKGYRNHIAEMDVDIVVDNVPDTATVQQEQFSDLMQLLGTNPAYAAQVPLTTLIKLSSIPNKHEVINEIEQFQQSQAQQAQEANALKTAAAVASINETNSKAAMNIADAHHTDAQTPPPPGVPGVGAPALPMPANGPPPFSGADVPPT